MALADYSKVLAAIPQSAAAWFWRAGVYERRQEWDKALADYGRAIERVPAAGGYLHERGRIHAILGHWVQADADTTVAVKMMRPAREHWWMELAAYRLCAGDVDGYRQACQGMLASFGTTEDPVIAHRVALSCLLLPDAVKGSSEPQKLAKLAATRFKDRWCVLTQGAALYRAGQYQGAADYLQPLLEGWPQANGAEMTDGGPVMLWLWLALANHRLGQAQEARQWLDKAVQTMDQETAEKTIGPLRRESHVWAMCLVLRREAEGLLKMPALGLPAPKKKT